MFFAGQQPSIQSDSPRFWFVDRSSFFRVADGLSDGMPVVGEPLSHEHCGLTFGVSRAVEYALLGANAWSPAIVCFSAPKSISPCA